MDKAFRPPREPVRPSAQRVERLRQLGDWHREWTAQHADTADFRPQEHPAPDSDYNQHHVLMDAPTDAQDQFHTRARQIMGLDS